MVRCPMLTLNGVGVTFKKKFQLLPKIQCATLVYD